VAIENLRLKPYTDKRGDLLLIFDNQDFHGLPYSARTGDSANGTVENSFGPLVGAGAERVPASYCQQITPGGPATAAGLTVPQQRGGLVLYAVSRNVLGLTNAAGAKSIRRQFGSVDCGIIGRPGRSGKQSWQDENPW